MSKCYERGPHHLMLDGAPGFNEERGVPNGCIIRPVPDLLTDALHRRKHFASDAHALQHCQIDCVPFGLYLRCIAG